MAERQKGMGRGLAAILAVSREDNEELRYLPLDLISPNQDQPRHHFDEESLGALAESIRIRGVLQPVIVRPADGGRYELIAGERRWRAAGLSGREEIPAIVRHNDSASALEMALVENMVREDLNPVEEARACAGLTEELGLSREDVGLRIGRSRVAVSNLLRLLDLPDEVLDLLERRELTEGHGRALLLAEDHGARRTLARDAVALGWSVRELESRARALATPSDATPRVRRRRPALHPDQAAAVEELSDAFGRALGAEVDVAPNADGYRVAMTFASIDEARELARRLALRDPA